MALLLSACIPPLDNSSTVHDLRILGMSMTPPELDYAVAGDGGFSCDPAGLFTALADTPVIQLSALVGDPAGNGRTLHYNYWGCPETGTELCPDGGGYLLASGDAPAPELDAQWPLAQMAEEEVLCDGGAACPATPLVTAFEDDPLGLCRFGVWFQVTLEVDAPDGETIYGSKLMVFTPVPQDYPADCPQGPALPGDGGGPPPHVNPQLAALDLDGQALPLDSAPLISASFAHTLRPIEPSNGPQPYCLPLFTGGWTHLEETWLYSAITDVGQLSREQVGGAAPLGSDTTGPSTDLNITWTFPDGGVGRTADLYEVTRDGRGGEAWIVRHAAVGP